MTPRSHPDHTQMTPKRTSRDMTTIHSKIHTKRCLSTPRERRAGARAVWGVVGVGWVGVGARWGAWGLRKVRVKVWVRWVVDQNPPKIIKNPSKMPS